MRAHLDLVDDTRATPAIGGVAGSPRRHLPTTVHLPDGPDPAPLILLAHGLFGHPHKFTELADHWAAAGYVVAVPRFPVTSDEFRGTWTDDFAERLADVAGQAGDVSFVISEVLAASAAPIGDLGGRVDARRVGLYGLSLGALTAWTTLLGDGLGDDRVCALVQSDGAYPGGSGRLAEVRLPVLVAHSDVDAVFAYDLVRAQFDSIGSVKYLLTLHGAPHAAVAENGPTPADAAYRAVTTVFWDRHLRQRPDAPFPDTVVVDGITSFVAPHRPNWVASASESAGFGRPDRRVTRRRRP